ncbi:MAG TPA: LarC family nickel insertion protein, partial [Pyrinomonadaceae bacterium]
PVPPPAVAELLSGAPVYSTEIEGELITPTGAAIIATVCEEFGRIPEMTIEKTSYGAGTRDYQDFPNVLRLILGKTENELRMTNDELRENESSENKNRKPKTENRNLILIETNIDDLSPQILGYVMERAFELGALDCWFTPIQMKKNRPATMVSVLCGEVEKKDLIEMLYVETSTLGVRVSEIERNCLPREIVKVETEFGAVDVKIARDKNKIVNAKPEYEQIRRIALQSKKSLREIEQEILRKLNE